MNRPPQIQMFRSERTTYYLDKEFLPELHERLFHDDPFFWPELRTIKASKVRHVLYGRIDRLAIFVKLFSAAKWSDRVRDAWIGARGVREFENLREARRRGLPTVRVIAAGYVNGSAGSKSFLITKTLTTVDGVANTARLTDHDTTHMLALGSLLRRVHDSGLHHRDLHPRNILVADGSALLLCDLTSATFVNNPLSLKKRARSLAFFVHELDGCLEDAQATPLVEGYGASRELVARTDREGRRLRNRMLHAFGRRATRECQQTCTQDVGAVRWLWHIPANDLRDAARQADLTEPPLKCSRRGAVWILDQLVVKERRVSKARKLFVAHYWMTFAGVPCAQPVALRIEHNRGFVYTRWVPGRTVLEEINQIDTPRALAERFGAEVGRLHAFGLRNRDMKLDNLVRNGDKIVMVDLEGVSCNPPDDSRGQGQDLGRLFAAYSHATCVDPTVVAAFWRGYLYSRRSLRAAPLDDLREIAETRCRAWFEAHPT